MNDILKQICLFSEFRVKEASKKVSFEEIKERALALPKGEFRFEKALKKSGLGFVCEVKKASPSKGVIAPNFAPVETAMAYEKGGAAAVSVLTEPKWFLGSDAVFRDVKSAVSLPVLRKDFTVSEYQIYEAKCLGADAVLLICACLDDFALGRFFEVASGLGLCALVETHSESEVKRALDVGARVVGVNNRNLRDFSVNFDNAFRLRELVGERAVFVAESGFGGEADMEALVRMRADAVLVGEALMRSGDKAGVLSRWIRKAECGMRKL